MSGSRDKITLVTGASGHLGANLVHRLVSDGERVRVLLRPHSNNSATDGLAVERVDGDLRDFESIDKALNGCRYVYHCAALVSTIDGNAQHQRDLFDANVIGTRNLLRAARHHQVERVVVSGSFSAYGYDLDHPHRAVDETQIMYPFGRNLPYSHTKVLVEQECLRAFAHGLDVVLATSTGIVGPHDYKPSRLGQTFCDFANGKLRFIIVGAHEFVAAHDIVAGHVLAMHKGRPGQSYLFSTACLSLDELVAMFAAVAGPQSRYIRLPARPMLPLAEVASFIMSRMFPKAPQRFTPGAIRRLMHTRRADITKAKTELGYKPSTILRAVREAYEFHCARGAITRPRQIAAGEIDRGARSQGSEVKPE